MKFLITNPGPAKRWRWLVACHEASHARAFSVLAGISSTLIIDRFGGLCVPSRRAQDMDLDQAVSQLPSLVKAKVADADAAALAAQALDQAVAKLEVHERAQH